MLPIRLLVSDGSFPLLAVSLASKVGSLSQESFDFCGGSSFSFNIADLEPDFPSVPRLNPGSANTCCGGNDGRREGLNYEFCKGKTKSID